MDIKEFNESDLSRRFTVIYNTGEFISAIRFTDFRVSLYIVDDHFIEVYFNARLDKIDEIRTLNGDEARLSLYAAGVNIRDLYR